MFQSDLLPVALDSIIRQLIDDDDVLEMLHTTQRVRLMTRGYRIRQPVPYTRVGLIPRDWLLVHTVTYDHQDLSSSFSLALPSSTLVFCPVNGLVANDEGYMYDGWAGPPTSPFKVDDSVFETFFPPFLESLQLPTTTDRLPLLPAQLRCLISDNPVRCDMSSLHHVTKYIIGNTLHEQPIDISRLSPGIQKLRSRSRVRRVQCTGGVLPASLKHVTLGCVEPGFPFSSTLLSLELCSIPKVEIFDRYMLVAATCLVKLTIRGCPLDSTHLQHLILPECLQELNLSTTDAVSVVPPTLKRGLKKLHFELFPDSVFPQLSLPDGLEELLVELVDCGITDEVVPASDKVWLKELRLPRSVLRLTLKGEWTHVPVLHEGLKHLILQTSYFPANYDQHHLLDSLQLPSSIEQLKLVGGWDHDEWWRDSEQSCHETTPIVSLPQLAPCQRLRELEVRGIVYGALSNTDWPASLESLNLVMYLPTAGDEQWLDLMMPRVVRMQMPSRLHHLSYVGPRDEFPVVVGGSVRTIHVVDYTNANYHRHVRTTGSRKRRVMELPETVEEVQLDDKISLRFKHIRE